MDDRTTLRPARAEDAEAIHALHARSVGDSFAGLLGGWVPPEDERRARERSWTGPIGTPQPRHALVVAERGGRLAGLVAVGPARDPEDEHDASAELRTVMVDARDRGTGVGSALVAAGERALHDAGFAEVTLWVVPENAAAVRCYERAGWRPDGAEKTWEVGGRLVRSVRYRKALGG